MPPRPAHPRRAFTLVELVMASGIIAILLVVVQSVIILASHAVPGIQSRSTTLTSASGVLADFDADLAFATAVTSRSATSVTFSVPDRNGDGAAETITWSWSGTPGTSLYRTFNTNAPVAMHANVQAFSLAFDTRAALGTPPTSTSAETLLASNPLVTGGTAKPVHDRIVDKKNTFGQFILPTLPANASTYSVSRIQLYLAYKTGNSAQTVALQSTDASNLPTSSIIDQSVFSFANIPATYTWTQFNFSAATALPATSGIAITVINTGGSSNVGTIDSQDVPSAAVLGNQLSSIDNGVTWTQAPANCNLLYYVYGTICTPGTPPTLYYLTGCRASLRTSVDPLSTARATVRILNEPQVSGP